MEKGLIVVAYQGMGKTTLTNASKGEYVDLESSGYDRSNPEWYKEYVTHAIELVTGDKPYKVCFMSSHKVVRDELEKSGFTFVIFYPYVEKKIMMERLATRYFADKTIKNASALANCVLDYEDNVNDLRKYKKSLAGKDGFISQALLKELTDIPYDKRQQILDVVAAKKQNVMDNLKKKPKKEEVAQ